MATSAGRTTPRPLPASLRFARIAVRGEATLFGTDMDDPAILRTEATVSIQDPPADIPSVREAAAGITGVSLDPVSQTSEGPVMTIFRATALVMDLARVQDPYDSLDADSQELETYGCLLDLPSGELHPDLLDRLEFTASENVVILERARLAPAWRGCGGLGRYLTGRVLPLICPTPAVIAGQPFPLDIPRDAHGRPDQAALGPAIEHMQRIWESIGFEPYKNDIWIINPSAATHEEAMAQLERKLGLD
jgi:hypothetical protein